MVDITTFRRLSTRAQKRFWGFSKLIERGQILSTSFFIIAVVCVLCYLGQKLRNRSLIFPLLLQTCKLVSVLPTTEVTGKKSTVCFNIFQQNRNSVSFLLDEIIRQKIRKNGWK